MRSRNFLFDLAALLPLDLLQLRLGTHPLLRFPRFCKVSNPKYLWNILINLNGISINLNDRCIAPFDSITSSKVVRFGRISGEWLISFTSCWFSPIGLVASTSFCPRQRDFRWASEEWHSNNAVRSNEIERMWPVWHICDKIIQFPFCIFCVSLFLLDVFIGRLGVSISTGWLCDVDTKISGQLVLVNADTDHNRWPADAGDERRVSDTLMFIVSLLDGNGNIRNSH